MRIKELIEMKSFLQEFLKQHNLLSFPFRSAVFTPVSEVAGRRQLRSASQRHLTVRWRHRLNTFGRLRACLVSSPTSLPDRLRNPTQSSHSFRETTQNGEIISELLNTLSAEEMIHDSVPYKVTTDIDIAAFGAGLK